MQRSVYLAFATVSRPFLERVAQSNPDFDLLVVARERPAIGEWVEVRPGQGNGAILDACRKAIAGRAIGGAAIHTTRDGIDWRLRIAAFRMAGRELQIYNDHLDHFRLADTPTLWRHLKWRWSQRRRGVLWWKALGVFAILCGRDHRLPWRGRRPSQLRHSNTAPEPGISLVIPTRDGRELLEAMLPAVIQDLELHPSEMIVVDNGSSDGSSDFLRQRYPQIRILISTTPLSFSEAVNRGIDAARFSHVALLNNDMLIEPGFFTALRCAFDRVPDLFCATAQIFFPEGRRREETGLCFWLPQPGDDFPVYCAEPQPCEDSTLVLYGSGGCSMYDTAKLRELGGFDETYRPAYVEDLDIGYRGWSRGWPTVFCAAAKVEHRHRATTSRYYTPDYLDYLVERNYLRFLVRATGEIFPDLWRAAIVRLENRAAAADPAARHALRTAWWEALARQSLRGVGDERRLKAALTR